MKIKIYTGLIFFLNWTNQTIKKLFKIIQYVYCPVGWGCRIHRLILCRGVRQPPMSVLVMTLNNLKVSFGECRAPLQPLSLSLSLYIYIYIYTVTSYLSQSLYHVSSIFRMHVNVPMCVIMWVWSSVSLCVYVCSEKQPSCLHCFYLMRPDTNSIQSDSLEKILSQDRHHFFDPQSSCYAFILIKQRRTETLILHSGSKMEQKWKKKKKGRETQEYHFTFKRKTIKVRCRDCNAEFPQNGRREKQSLLWTVWTSMEHSNNNFAFANIFICLVYVMCLCMLELSFV